VDSTKEGSDEKAGKTQFQIVKEAVGWNGIESWDACCCFIGQTFCNIVSPLGSTIICKKLFYTTEYAFELGKSIFQINEESIFLLNLIRRGAVGVKT